MSPEERIRRRVLRAIALNRTPGYHFPGNFIDLSFDRVESANTRLSYEIGEHNAGDIGSLAVLADFALGTAVRADLDPATRLATVSMTLELARDPGAGTVSAAARCHGFIDHRIGRSRVLIEGASGEIGYGSGAFMVLEPPPGVTLHPVPMRKRGDAEPPLLAEADLAPEELAILRHAEQALERARASGEPFIRHFWGFLPQPRPGGASCVMPNGPHVGNRVGFVQGGILLGLAAATATAALPEAWMLSSVAAAFISPGQGPALHADATVVHQGQRACVIRTEVTRGDGRRVLEAMSTHVRRTGLTAARKEPARGSRARPA